MCESRGPREVHGQLSGFIRVCLVRVCLQLVSLILLLFRVPVLPITLRLLPRCVMLLLEHSWNTQVMRFDGNQCLLDTSLHGIAGFRLWICHPRSRFACNLHERPAACLHCLQCTQMPTDACQNCAAGGRIWHEGHHPVPKNPNPCPQKRP